MYRTNINDNKLMFSFNRDLQSKLWRSNFDNRSMENESFIVYDICSNQQSVGFISNGVSLSNLIEFVSQFESSKSHIYWENMCLPIWAEIANMSCGTGLKMHSTVGSLSKISRVQNKKKNTYLYCSAGMRMTISMMRNLS